MKLSINQLREMIPAARELFEELDDLLADIGDVVEDTRPNVVFSGIEPSDDGLCPCLCFARDDDDIEWPADFEQADNTGA